MTAKIPPSSMPAWSMTSNIGGVFRSVDAGAHWEQLGAGLDGRDVFALAETKDGAIVAGTSHGIFVLGGGDPPASASIAAPASAPGDPAASGLAEKAPHASPPTAGKAPRGTRSVRARLQSCRKRPPISVGL